MSIVDDKKVWLEGQPGVKPGPIPDMEKDWLLVAVSPYTGALPDLWKVYLTTEGYEGTVPEMRIEWLADGNGWV